jgi:hypothetical protein
LLQTVLAMAVGMVTFIVVFHTLLTSAGYLALQTQSPFLWFASMSVFMTAPMIVLMRYHQRHSWRDCTEMIAAMLVPSGVLAALVQFDVVVYPWLDVRTLSHSTHVAMLLGMIILMLYRRDKFAAVRPSDARADKI